MMKIAMVAVAGLVLGLLGGTGVAAVRTKGDVLAAHAKAVSDSTAVATRSSTVSGDDGSVPVVVPSGTADPATERSDSSTEGTPQSGSTSDGRKVSPPADATSSASEPGTPSQESVSGSDTASPDSAASAGSTGTKVSPAGAKKLAKIFGTMKPADAASVLAQMSDSDVTAILQQMNDRLAGPILGALAPKRAAALSEAVLRGRESGA